MTFRTYLRWPESNRVSDKTTTESESVANYALCDLLHRYHGQPAQATLVQREGNSKPKRLALVELAYAKRRECERCNYTGAFIDEGETCPNCRLVQ